MKRLLAITLCLMFTLTACGSKDTTPVRSEAATKENTEITLTPKPTETPEATQSVVASSSEEMQSTIENPSEDVPITLDLDLSLFGDLVNTLFVVTNDVSQLTTKEEAYNYLVDNGYTLHPAASIYEPEATLLNRQDHYVWEVWNDSLNQYASASQRNFQSSVVSITNAKGYLYSIVYTLFNPNIETYASFRDRIDELSSNWLDSNYVIVEKGPDENDWEGCYISFHDKPVGEYYTSQHSTKFAEIVVKLKNDVAEVSFYLYSANDPDVVKELKEDTIFESASTSELVPTEAPTSTVTLDCDMSLFGDLVNSLFVVTNDESSRTTKEQTFNYFVENGYEFYEHGTGSAHVVRDLSDLTEDGKYEVYHSSFSDWSSTPELSSVITITVADGLLQKIVVSSSNCNTAYFGSFGDNVDSLIESWKANGAAITVRDGGVSGTGGYINRIYFNGRPCDESSSKDYFASVDISYVPEAKSIQLTFELE